TRLLTRSYTRFFDAPTVESLRSARCGLRTVPLVEAKYVKRQAAICVASMMMGCASAAQVKPDPEAPATASSPVALRVLERQNDAQAERTAELEARLGLLEQEARQLRQTVQQKPVETVRIGGEHRERDEDDDFPP